MFLIGAGSAKKDMRTMVVRGCLGGGFCGAVGSSGVWDAGGFVVRQFVGMVWLG